MAGLGCVLLGPPGSGKGTQAKRLSATFSIPHISTGDILRKEVSEGSELGKRVQSIIQSGQLVSDDLMTEIVRKRFQESDIAKGYLLDGYPRTVAQAEAFRTIVKLAPKVLFFDLSEDQLIGRLTGRLSCTQCGAVYHLSLNPPKKPNICDACGHKSLTQRKDDSEETARRRLEVYNLETAPLLDYYKRTGELTRIDASTSVDEMTKAVEKLVRG